MSDKISVDSVELIKATSDSQTAIGGLNVAIEEWTSQGEKSIALEAFSQQFVELEKAMELYQKLLNQDVESIRKLGLEMFMTDFKISRLWGKG